MDAREFFYELGKLVYRIDGAYEDYGRGCKLNSSNLLWILYALNDGAGHSQKQICDDWAIPRSTANTIVKDLQDKGFVTLAQIKGERRELLVSLTPAGKEYAEGILADLYRRERDIFAGIARPDELISALGDLAEQMQNIAKNNF